MGTRLRGTIDGIPKGLIEIDGETLVGRSLAQLRQSGVERFTIVTGYAADAYERFAAGRAGVQRLVNNLYAETGSMASLALALETLDEDMLILESDIVYESRALAALLDAAAPDATLISGPTGAGDEVWVCAPEGRLVSMSKTRTELPSVAGELVGITRLSAAGARAMRTAYETFVDRHGHARMDYETDGLVAVARHLPISTVLIDDLCWGEIDDERHLDRVRRQVWPTISGSERPMR
jgi:2-aminoethylphosphonate-pyruvate transaminase